MVLYDVAKIRTAQRVVSRRGVIFVSIDDNEQSRLKSMLDEIFEERNHIATIVVNSNPGGRDYGGIARTHDYVLVYGRGCDSGLDMISIDDGDLPLHDADSGFELRELRNRNKHFNDKNRPNLFYPFYVDIRHTDVNGFHPVSVIPKRGWVETYPEKTEGIQTVWRWGKEKVEKNTNNVIGRKKRSGTFGIWEKFRRTGKRQRSIFYDSKYRTESGTLLIKEIFGTTVFSYPKSLDLIKDLFTIGTKKNSIILDSTAGSGTTGHAVLALNNEDGGGRKFILIELEDYADKITAERVRRVIKGVPKSKDEQLRKGFGGSFTYCTLGKPVDVEKMLMGKSLPDFSTLASFLLYQSYGISTTKLLKVRQDGLFYSEDERDFYLLYKPDIHYLQKNASLTEQKTRQIASKGRTAIVFAPEKESTQNELSALGITFCRLPDAIMQGGVNNTT